MVLRYPAADCEAHARSFVFVASVQALEHGEDAINVLLVKTNTVVFKGDLTELLRLSLTTTAGRTLLAADKLTVNSYDRSPARRVKLKRVAYEVLEELPHLQGFGVDRRDFT